MVKFNFYEYLEEIEETGSTTDKEALISEMLYAFPESEEFLRITFNGLVYNLAETTFFNAFQDIFEKEAIDGLQLEHISNYLKHLEGVSDIISIEALEETILELSSKSGNDLISFIKDSFAILHPLQKKWWCRALLHDLRMGANLKTINKVFKEAGKKTIEKYEVQLCDKIDVYDEVTVAKKIRFPCTMECKYDGYRIQADIWTNESGTNVRLMSRRGKDKTEDYPVIVDALKEAFEGCNTTLDGEIKARSFQALTRKDDTSDKNYIVFDLLEDENLPYIERWNNLLSLFVQSRLAEVNNGPNHNIIVTQINTVILLAEHYEANNITELQIYFDALNERREEGIIIKNHDRPYERGTRKNMFKCKKVMTADLKIIGWNPGEGKRSAGVGSLKLEDKSGAIKVDVGSGIDDATYAELTQQIEEHKLFPAFLDKICEIKFNEITETGSIRFPRFVCIRDDKDEADDLSYLNIRQAKGEEE